MLGHLQFLIPSSACSRRFVPPGTSRRHCSHSVPPGRLFSSSDVHPPLSFPIQPPRNSAHRRRFIPPGTSWTQCHCSHSVPLLLGLSAVHPPLPLPIQSQNVRLQPGAEGLGHFAPPRSSLFHSSSRDLWLWCFFFSSAN
jgi:hypothetical protein